MPAALKHARRHALTLPLLLPALAAAVPGVVRFAPEHDYGPFVFAGPDGRIAGLSVDLLRLVEQRAGLRLQVLPAAPLALQLERARRGEVDLLSSLRPTPERAEFLDFTAPYVRVPAVLMVRRSATPAAGAGAQALPLRALTGLPVAVGAGYAVEPVMRRAYPEVRWVAVSDDAVALRGVQDGRFAAAVVDSASANFVMRRERLDDLASAGQVGFEYELSFAVRKGSDALLATLDETLRAIPAAEKRAIVRRWVGEELGATEGSVRAPRATLVGAALLVAAALSALWSWRRPRAAVPTR